MTLARTLLAVLAGIVVLEVAAYAIIWLAGLAGTRIWRRRSLLADQSKKLDRLANAADARVRIHPTLGWDNKPDYRVPGAHTNAMGLRGPREYDANPKPGVPRVAAFGDSFTYAGEVRDDEAWPARMEAGWVAEVLNYGIGAYGPDQVYLRYLDEGALMKPDFVLIGFISPMATRVVSRYRRFQKPEDGPWFKPRFVLDGDDLRLIPPPVASHEDAQRLIENAGLVSEICEPDFWYVPAIYEHRLYDWSATYRVLTQLLSWAHRCYLHPDRIQKGPYLNPDGEAYRILVRLYGEFGRAVRANGAEPVVMMFPTVRDVRLYAAGKGTSYRRLGDALEAEGLQVIDLTPPLVDSGTPRSALFAPRGHLSARGNALVATAVAGALGLVPRDEEARADV